MSEKIVEPLTFLVPFISGAGLYHCVGVQKIVMIVSLYSVYMLATCIVCYVNNHRRNKTIEFFKLNMRTSVLACPSW